MNISLASTKSVIPPSQYLVYIYQNLYAIFGSRKSQSSVQTENVQTQKVKITKNNKFNRKIYQKTSLMHRIVSQNFKKQRRIVENDPGFSCLTKPEWITFYNVIQECDEDFVHGVMLPYKLQKIQLDQLQTQKSYYLDSNKMNSLE